MPDDSNKSEVSDKRILAEESGFAPSVMVSVAISKLGKPSIHIVEPGTKVNREYYRNALLHKLIPEMDELTNGEYCLFMQDGARSHTAKDTIALLHQQDCLQLLEPGLWPQTPLSQHRRLQHFGVLFTKVYRGRIITNLEQLKSAITEEWEKLPQSTINNAINAFRGRLRRVIEMNGGHTETCY